VRFASNTSVSCDFTNCVFKNVSFNSNYFKYTDFNKCTFDSCYFDSNVLKFCEFNECNIKLTYFKGPLKGVEFEKCEIDPHTKSVILQQGGTITN
jgi:uncharacterized protein YjbI with pentapeptide repeats